MFEKQREGVLVIPYGRLSETQVRLVDEISRELLQEPGLLCFSSEVSNIFKNVGAKIEESSRGIKIRIPSAVIDRALKSAPSKIILGARDINNQIILDAYEPRVRFGSGSETNIWLDVEFEGTKPIFVRSEGSIQRLCWAAHLCEHLEHLDFFIRCVNIRDKEITNENKDVNKFLASLNNTTKHVQADITNISALDDIIRMGEIITGSKENFRKKPVLSFITCVIKSPLQVVEDTAAKLIEISKRRVPVVISSSPMGGTTAPFDEFGMVAQINAEILAGVALNQIVSPGAPVFYGSVPVRTRLDNLNDMYGAPEFNHYNIDCVQMARYYGLPCYSTAGVGDADVPGIQATVEKMLTLMSVPRSGAQYVHYAFGLLERTNTFSPEQAIMDDVHIGIIKRMLKPSEIYKDKSEGVLTMIREVMKTSHKTYMYNLPLPSRENVYIRYPLECDEGDALMEAHRLYNEIMSISRNSLPKEIQKELILKVPGILPGALNS